MLALYSPAAPSGMGAELRRHGSKYIVQQPRVRAWLRALRERHGKRLFLLTNAAMPHADTVAGIALGEDWLSLFDLVIDKATKRSFFSGADAPAVAAISPGSAAAAAMAGGDAQRGRGFVELDLRMDRSRPVAKRGGPAALRAGGVFRGGNARELTAFLRDDVAAPASPAALRGDPGSPGRATRQVHGSRARVLYIGDHPVEDVALPRQFGWDTVLVARELEGLLASAVTGAPPGGCVPRWADGPALFAPGHTPSFMAMQAMQHAALVVPSVDWLAAVPVHAELDAATARKLLCLPKLQGWRNLLRPSSLRAAGGKDGSGGECAYQVYIAPAVPAGARRGAGQDEAGLDWV